MWLSRVNASITTVSSKETNIVQHTQGSNFMLLQKVIKSFDHHVHTLRSSNSLCAALILRTNLYKNFFLFLKCTFVHCPIYNSSLLWITSINWSNNKLLYSKSLKHHTLKMTTRSLFKLVKFEISNLINFIPE